MRLARALLALAAPLLPVLEPDARAASLAAIARFADDPRPSAYLAARRALVGAARARLAERGAEDRGLRAVTMLAAAGLPADVCDALGSVRLDATTSGRLDALAALVTAERELAARVSAAAAAWRARWR